MTGLLREPSVNRKSSAVDVPGNGRMGTVVNATRAGAVVADRVRVAASAWSRAMGLMGRMVAPGEGLLILPCNGIHMFFMRVPIDAVFLDPGLRVLKVVRDLKPWRVVPYVRGARCVLELRAGAADRVKEGDFLEWEAR